MTDPHLTEDQRQQLTEDATESWTDISRYARQANKEIVASVERFAHAMEQLAGFQLPLIHPTQFTPVVSHSDGSIIPQSGRPLGMTGAAVDFIVKGVDPQRPHEPIGQWDILGPEQRAAFSTTLTAALHLTQQQDIFDQLAYMEFCGETIHRGTLFTEGYGGLTFSSIQEQVDGFVAHHRSTLGSLNAQFVAAHGYRADFLEHLAEHLYHKGDTTSEHLQLLNTSILTELTERFTEEVQDMRAATEQYIRKVRNV